LVSAGPSALRASPALAPLRKPSHRSAMNPDTEPPADAAPTHDDLVKGLLSHLRLLVEFFRAFLPEVLE